MLLGLENEQLCQSRENIIKISKTRAYFESKSCEYVKTSLNVFRWCTRRTISRELARGGSHSFYARCLGQEKQRSHYRWWEIVRTRHAMLSLLKSTSLWRFPFFPLARLICDELFSFAPPRFSFSFVNSLIYYVFGRLSTGFFFSQVYEQFWRCKKRKIRLEPSVRFSSGCVSMTYFPKIITYYRVLTNHVLNYCRYAHESREKVVNFYHSLWRWNIFLSELKLEKETNYCQFSKWTVGWYYCLAEVRCRGDPSLFQGRVGKRIVKSTSDSPCQRYERASLSCKVRFVFSKWQLSSRKVGRRGGFTEKISTGDFTNKTSRFLSGLFSSE